MTRKELEDVLAVVEKVIRGNHDYYVSHPKCPMDNACMWPDELMNESRLTLEGKQLSCP